MSRAGHGKTASVPSTATRNDLDKLSNICPRLQLPSVRAFAATNFSASARTSKFFVVDDAAVGNEPGMDVRAHRPSIPGEEPIAGTYYSAGCSSTANGLIRRTLARIRFLVAWSVALAKRARSFFNLALRVRRRAISRSRSTRPMLASVLVKIEHAAKRLVATVPKAAGNIFVAGRRRTVNRTPGGRLAPS